MHLQIFFILLIRKAMSKFVSYIGAEYGKENELTAGRRHEACLFHIFDVRLINMKRFKSLQALIAHFAYFFDAS